MPADPRMGSVPALQITGPHDVRRVPVCRVAPRTAGSAGCRIVEWHRFDVLCGRKRVPWADIAGVIAAGASAVPAAQASDPARCAPSLSARGRLDLVCGPLHGTAMTRITAPFGYAPLGELGAKIIAAPVASTIGPGGAKTSMVPTPVTSEPLADLVPVSTADNSEQRIGRLGYVQNATAVTLTVAPAASHATPPASSWPWLLTLTLLGTLSLTAAVVSRRYWPERTRQIKARSAGATLRLIEAAERSGGSLHQGMTRVRTTARRVARGIRHVVPAHLRLKLPRFNSPPPIADLNAANAVTVVSQMLASTEARLADLTTAGPLVDVLHQELDQFHQRLAALTATAAESTEQAGRASPAFRNLMRDLERVRRIADSAAVSMGAGRSATRIPATKSEAFDLLGLNPDAPAATLKKVADGLRMSWHPDHARDTADRAEREARIKAINAAVELINGRRAA